MWWDTRSSLGFFKELQDRLTTHSLESFSPAKFYDINNNQVAKERLHIKAQRLAAGDLTHSQL